MLEITEDKLYTFIINSEYQTLSQDIITEIGRLMIAWHTHHNIGKPFPIVAFLGENEWRWMSSRGTLPKRIKKWYYDTFKTALDDKVLTGIGNYVRKEVVKNQTYYLDFTKNFNWKSGDYGDHGSCFFSDRSDIRHAMSKDSRFMAIRFYAKKGIPDIFKGVEAYIAKENPKYHDDENLYFGHSRAWMAREIFSYKHKNVKKDFEAFIIFNAYGHTTQTIASIFSHFSGMGMKNIVLSNKGKAVGGLYFNEGGYLIAPKEVLESVHAYDFGMDDNRSTINIVEDAKGFQAKAIAPVDEDRNYFRLKYSASSINGLLYKAAETSIRGSMWDSVVDVRRMLKRENLLTASVDEQYSYFEKVIRDETFKSTMEAYNKFRLSKMKPDDSTIKAVEELQSQKTAAQLAREMLLRERWQRGIRDRRPRQVRFDDPNAADEEGILQHIPDEPMDRAWLDAVIAN